MTTQEAYERIRAYFTQPGAIIARTEAGFCRYRTETGAKCAVGCLIPDELYHPDIEGGNLEVILLSNHANDVTAQAVLTHLGVTSTQDDLYKFLRDAQQAHDARASSVAEFINLLDVLAFDHNLDVIETKTDEGENQ